MSILEFKCAYICFETKKKNQAVIKGHFWHQIKFLKLHLTFTSDFFFTFKYII